MKRFMQSTALAVVMLLMSLTAWAFSPFDHVSQAPNGKGDVLIYPNYMVLDGGFKTRIQVINTSENKSAVAKVVVRSPILSLEVRDFFIFLSPTDMWEGVLKEINGEVHIYSEDDSTLTSSAPTFATPDNPFEYNLDVKCNDTDQYGYVEVFLAHVFDEDYQFPGEPVSTNLTRAIVDKDDIFRAYIGNGDVRSPNPVTGYTPANGILNNKEVNILAGFSYIETAIPGWSAALNPVVLKDFGIFEVQGLFETTLADDSLNSLLEVEAALSKAMIAMPYVNDGEDFTLHFFHFPTKLVELDECRVTGVTGEFVGFNRDYDRYGVRASILGFDMEERSTTPDPGIVSPLPEGQEDIFKEELSLFADFDQQFEKGWYRYAFDPVNRYTEGRTADDTRMRYLGAPVIPYVLNFGASGFNMHYGAWTDGQVEFYDDVDDIWIISDGYQFSRGFGFTN